MKRFFNNYCFYFLSIIALPFNLDAQIGGPANEIEMTADKAFLNELMNHEVESFLDLIEILVNDADEDLINLILDYFFNYAEIEVSSKNGPSINYSPIDYADHYSFLPYDSIELTTRVIKNGELYIDGGKLLSKSIFRQSFKGKVGSKIIYGDITIKNIQGLFFKTKAGDWKIKFERISVIETK